MLLKSVTHPNKYLPTNERRISTFQANIPLASFRSYKSIFSGVSITRRMKDTQRTLGNPNTISQMMLMIINRIMFWHLWLYQGKYWHRQKCAVY